MQTVGSSPTQLVPPPKLLSSISTTYLVTPMTMNFVSLTVKVTPHSVHSPTREDIIIWQTLLCHEYVPAISVSFVYFILTQPKLTLVNCNFCILVQIIHAKKENEMSQWEGGLRQQQRGYSSSSSHRVSLAAGTWLALSTPSSSMDNNPRRV